MSNIHININEQQAQTKSTQYLAISPVLRLQDKYPLPKKFNKLEKGVWLDILKVYKFLRIKAYSFHNFKSVLYERYIFEKNLILDIKNNKVLILNTLGLKGGAK